MTTVSGVSNIGTPVLVSASPPVSLALSIAITSQPLPPQRRVGYFWLYTFLNASPFQCYMVGRGAVYAPGIFEEFKRETLPANWSLRVDVVFDEAGLNYTIVLI